jgi:hypothetical protein
MGLLISVNVNYKTTNSKDGTSKHIYKETTEKQDKTFCHLTSAIAPVIIVRGKIYMHAFILSIFIIFMTRRNKYKIRLRKTVWFPSTSTTFQRELAPEIHLAKV